MPSFENPGASELNPKQVENSPVSPPSHFVSLIDLDMLENLPLHRLISQLGHSIIGPRLVLDSRFAIVSRWLGMTAVPPEGS